MKYKVTVCIPVYNMEQYLEECIISLVNQTIKEIELIFVNDGSTDRSLEILNRYAKKYSCITVVSQVNKGLGGARNAALKIAKGEYIGFVDADDFVANNMYENLYNLTEDTSIDVAMCNVAISSSIKCNKKVWFNDYNGKLNGSFLNRNTQPWNKIFSRKLINKIDFKFNDKCGDGQVIFLMLSANNIISTNETLYFYRAGHVSMSTDYKLENLIRSLEYSIEDLEKVKKHYGSIKMEDYFEYRVIYDCLQVAAIAALNHDEDRYKYSTNVLKSLNYKNNKYLDIILSKEYSRPLYLGMVHMLPRSYYFSSMAVGIIHKAGLL